MIIFITGATSGFGKAMSERFLKNGHRVIALGRRIENLNFLKEKYNDSIYLLKIDLRNTDELCLAIENLPTKWKKIDVLINNAGLAIGTSPAQKSNLEDWNTMVQTNITAVLTCTQKILPLMILNNSGHVINLGSVAGEFPYPGGNVYGATKAFIHQFTLNLKADLLGTNIKVTCIEPGMCETEFSIVRFNGDLQKADEVYKNMTPLTAEDIAETIDWVLTRPAHVNINILSLMPVDQAFSPFSVNRKLNS